jgi:hypothetical protein
MSPAASEPLEAFVGADSPMLRFLLNVGYLEIYLVSGEISLL